MLILNGREINRVIITNGTESREIDKIEINGREIPLEQLIERMVNDNGSDN